MKIAKNTCETCAYGDKDVFNVSESRTCKACIMDGKSKYRKAGPKVLKSRGITEGLKGFIYE